MSSLRTFYILVITQTLSIIGSRMTGFAIGIWVFSDTGDTTPIFLVAFFSWLPNMLGGSLAGVFADRLNRRNLIILGDAGQAVPTLLVMLSFATGNFQLWQLYGMALVQALFGLIQNPAITASITMLVPDSHRDRANAITEVVGPMAGMLAPILAGVLYGFINIEGVMLVDVATFMVAVAVISTIQIPQPEREPGSEDSTFWRELREGFRFLLDRRALLILSLYFTFLNFVTSGIWRLMTPYVLVLTEYDEALTGVIMAISSFGLVTGGLIMIAWQGTRPRIHTIMPSLLFAALGLILFGMVRSPFLLAVIVFLMMLPYKMDNALLSSIQQSKIPPHMQGRVFALLSQISIFALPLTYLITGPIVDELLMPAVGKPGWGMVQPLVGTGPGAAMGLYIIICGLLLLVATLLVYAAPMIRHLERDLPDYNLLAQQPVLEGQAAD